MLKSILQRPEDSRNARFIHRLSVAALFVLTLISLFVIHENFSTVLSALAGTLLYKVGSDRSSILTILLGLILQLAGSYVFLDKVFYPFQATSFTNYYFYSCLLIGCAALYTSYCVDHSSATLKKWKGAFSLGVILWGMCWLYYGGAREISMHPFEVGGYNMLLLYFCAVSIVMTIIAEKLDWPHLSLAQMILLPSVSACCLWGLVEITGYYHLFGARGWLVWLVAFFCLYRLLHHYDGVWPERLAGFWHAGCLWLVVIVVAHEVAWFCFARFGFPDIICLSVSFGLAMLGGLLVILLRNLKIWPLTKYRNYYIWSGILMPAVSLVIYELVLILGR